MIGVSEHQQVLLLPLPMTPSLIPSHQLLSRVVIHSQTRFLIHFLLRQLQQMMIRSLHRLQRIMILFLILSLLKLRQITTLSRIRSAKRRKRQIMTRSRIRSAQRRKRQTMTRSRIRSAQRRKRQMMTRFLHRQRRKPQRKMILLQICSARLMNRIRTVQLSQRYTAIIILLRWSLATAMRPR